MSSTTHARVPARLNRALLDRLAAARHFAAALFSAAGPPLAGAAPVQVRCGGAVIGRLTQQERRAPAGGAR